MIFLIWYTSCLDTIYWFLYPFGISFLHHIPYLLGFIFSTYVFVPQIYFNPMVIFNLNSLISKALKFILISSRVEYLHLFQKLFFLCI